MLSQDWLASFYMFFNLFFLYIKLHLGFGLYDLHCFRWCLVLRITLLQSPLLLLLLFLFLLLLQFTIYISSALHPLKSLNNSYNWCHVICCSTIHYGPYTACCTLSIQSVYIYLLFLCFQLVFLVRVCTYLFPFICRESSLLFIFCILMQFFLFWQNLCFFLLK